MEEKKKLIFSKDYKKIEELGLINVNRWEEGIEHHPLSERLVRFMADHDFNDYNDSMCIKVGGDGDNGEHMMYLMDAFFEMLDKDNEPKENKFNVTTYSIQEGNKMSYVHWSEGLNMLITKDDVTLKLNSDEIQQLVKALPRTIGGRF